MMFSEQQKPDYSDDLDQEIRFILEEYRDGNLSVYQLMKLIDATCREHLERNIDDTEH